MLSENLQKRKTRLLAAKAAREAGNTPINVSLLREAWDAAVHQRAPEINMQPDDLQWKFGGALGDIDYLLGSEMEDCEPILHNKEMETRRGCEEFLQRIWRRASNLRQDKTVEAFKLLIEDLTIAANKQNLSPPIILGQPLEFPQTILT